MIEFLTRARSNHFISGQGSAPSFERMQQAMESTLAHPSKPAPIQSSVPTPGVNTSEPARKWRPRGEYKDVTSEMLGKTLTIIGAPRPPTGESHWRAGNTDIRFFREGGPGIATGGVAAQLAAPHVRGSVITGVFAFLCLAFANEVCFSQTIWPDPGAATRRLVPQHRRPRDGLRPGWGRGRYP
jgi:hypothetical protein